MTDSTRTKWRLITLTYNVNGNKPDPESVIRLLDSEKLDEADFVAIGLQEVTNYDVSSFTPPEVTWSKQIASWMTSRRRILLKKTYLASNKLLLFTKIQILPKINRVNLRYSRATLCGLAGYKGSISVRIDFVGQQTSLCFVTSHMFHSEKLYWKRADQYNNSYAHCSFKSKQSTESDFVIWMGDLNWRLDSSKDALKVVAELAVLEGDTSALEEYVQKNDQLSRAMVMGHAFHHFKEGPIFFQPTYRMRVGTMEYDLKRVPSWCDRILYKENDNIKLIRYNSNSGIRLSDHLPVIGEFECSVLTPEESDLVRFLPLEIWYSGVPFSCRFIFESSYWKREGSYKDWIGLYESDVPEVENPLKYVFAVSTYDEMFEGRVTTLAEFPILEAGTYRTGYFSCNRGCLIGISPPFTVSSPQTSIESAVSASERH
ncbi:hypothetical protein L596_018478 [Steinernema carpocapsae]|uniref:Inositol polyphosphate-related phosphatase domain-containing protein n=1 Tax=Steinernema carpocapsae TaxID=34508 RepID=A0A4U5N5G8_STECR|nr:hypothetical protein L596_018478 [Steinernema carpocapsae]